MAALLLVLQNSALASPMRLDGAGSYPLAGHLEMLSDPSGKLSLADVLASEVASRFIPLPGNLSKSYSRHVVWVRFSAIRGAAFPENAWLRLGPPYVDFVTVYVQSGADPALSASYREIRLGDHVPVAERPVQHAEFVTPLPLPLEKQITFLIRVESTSVLNLAGAIHTPADMLRYDNTGLMLQGSYLGITLVIALLNLIYYLRIGDRLFLYFSSYVLFMFLMHLGATGFITLIWPSMAHRLSDYLAGMGVGLLALTFSFFAIRLFNTRPASWPHCYLVLMMILGGVTILSVPFGFYGSIAPVTLIGSTGMIMLMVLLSFRAIRNGDPAGMLYLVAYGISNVGYIAQFFRLLGLLPLTWWNANAVQFASVANMVLMSLALTERMRAAEQRAITAAQQAEQKAVDLAKEMTVELRNALASEHQAVERQAGFLAMLSHEYRTPLAIIQANLDLLQLKENEASAQPVPQLATMKHAVKRLVEVMELAVHKEQMGRTGTFHDNQCFELIPFLDDVIDTAENLWPERSFIFTPGNESGAVTADYGQLKTVLLNLLDNACKYSPVGMPVSITLSCAAGLACITVRDHGAGIVSDDPEAIFDKHRRGAAGNGTRGAGVGLWLVRQILEQHGGNVSLTSAASGGTIATVRMPLTEVVAIPAPEAPAASPL